MQSSIHPPEDVTIACEEIEKYVTAVTDNGIGIPTEALPKVFDSVQKSKIKILVV